MSASELGEHAGYLGDAAEARRVRAGTRRAARGRRRRPRPRRRLRHSRACSPPGQARASCTRSTRGRSSAPPPRSPSSRRFADRIVHIRGRSTEIELPEPRRRGRLRPDRRVRPRCRACSSTSPMPVAGCSARTACSCRRRSACSSPPPNARRFVTRSTSGGRRRPASTSRSFGELAVNTEHHVDGDQVRLLGPALQVAADQLRPHRPDQGWRHATIDVEGRCDGLVGWFEADMGGGVTLTNHPGDPGRMRRWCNLYPTSDGVHACERATPSRSHVDVRPLLERRHVARQGHRRRRKAAADERHSTLLGQFLAADDLARAGGAPVAATPIGRAVARALELADGTRSTDEVAGATAGRDTSSALDSHVVRADSARHAGASSRRRSTP